jgi:hypothetical protein
MTRDKYIEIRPRTDFLQMYFILEGGSRIPPLMFETLLSKWLQARGLHPQKGREIILYYLDKKFG